MKKYIPFIIFCALTLICVGFIFANSAKNGVESGASSSAVVEFIENILRRLGFEADVSERFVRKLAHFLEYMLLSLLVCADVFTVSEKEKRIFKNAYALAAAPVFCFIIANIDEFIIQAATVGRGPSFRDVCIDTSGAFVGVVAFLALMLIVSAIKRRSVNL